MNPDQSDDIRSLPDMVTLHERHFGLTPEIGGSYAQAAAVCLDRYHGSPAVLSFSCDDEPGTSSRVMWAAPSARVRGAWANQDDATRDGAYGLALASAEDYLGLVALRRAETRSGVDYYLAPAGADVNQTDGELDLEASLRIEVSGMSATNSEAEIQQRLRVKINQARAGASSLPALACVVAFNRARIVFRRVL